MTSKNLGSGVVVLRGFRYIRDMTTKKGRGNKSSVQATFRSMEYIIDEDDAERLVRKTAPDDMHEDVVQRRIARLLEFAADPDPYAQQPEYVPEEYGYVRAVDALVDLYYDTDAGDVRKWIAATHEEMAKAMMRHMKLSMDARMETFLQRDDIQVMMQDILGYKRAVVNLKATIKELEEAVIAEGKKDVCETISWYGDELVSLRTDPERKKDGERKLVKYNIVLPTKFQFTRGDCGDNIIHGEIMAEGDSFVTVLRQKQDDAEPVEIVGRPTKRSLSSKRGNPMTNSTMEAVKELVMYHGGNPKSVSYNVQEDLYKWDVA